MKAFEQVLTHRRDIFHETDLLPALQTSDAPNVRKVLALEIGQSVNFPSGASWRRVADDTLKTFTLICRKSGGKQCKYCGAESSRLCDYPVTRDGKPGTCDVAMCSRCTIKGGPDIDHCHQHAKLVRTGGATGR